jgi:hypothetical protein
MADWDDNDKAEGGGLSDIQQMQMDAIILDTAYNNAWMLLAGEITFDELISSQFSEGKELVMAYDPDNGPKLEELENIIAYFVEEEDYEKCAKLRDIMFKAYPETYKA